MIVFLAALLMILGLIGRMVYLMVFDAEYYQKKAEDLHERERKIKAARGCLLYTSPSPRDRQKSRMPSSA